MTKNNIPVFEVNGEKYEIRRNRYLQAELDELQKANTMTEEEQVLLAKEDDFTSRLEKLNDRKEELYDKYLETFDDKDYAIYQKAMEAYDALLDKASEIKSIRADQRKKLVDMGEILIKKSLKIDNEGRDIRSDEEVNEIWQNFVDEFGQSNVIQFVIFTLNYIVGGDDDIENPFLTQAKAKAEQKANMKKGIQKAK